MFFKRRKNNLTKVCGSLGKRSRGAILIEFAFSIPVLITLLLYIHDLYQIKNIQNTIKSIGYQMINMIQNVSIRRSDRLITNLDLNNSSIAAFLSYFPGTTGISTTQDGKTYAKGMYGFFILWYLKGVGNNKAKVCWTRSLNWQCGNESSICSYALNEWTSVPQIQSSKESNKDIDVSTIRDELLIEKDEIKMVLEISLFVGGPGGSPFYYPDGTDVYDVSRQKRFGFFVIDPPKPYNATRTVFNTVFVFSPRPDIFNEDGPQMSSSK